MRAALGASSRPHRWGTHAGERDAWLCLAAPWAGALHGSRCAFWCRWRRPDCRASTTSESTDRCCYSRWGRHCSPALLFGSLPIFKYAGARLSTGIREGGRANSQSREQHRTRSGSVISAGCARSCVADLLWTDDSHIRRSHDRYSQASALPQSCRRSPSPSLTRK